MMDTEFTCNLTNSLTWKCCRHYFSPPSEKQFKEQGRRPEEKSKLFLSLLVSRHYGS